MCVAAFLLKAADEVWPDENPPSVRETVPSRGAANAPSNDEADLRSVERAAPSQTQPTRVTGSPAASTARPWCMFALGVAVTMLVRVGVRRRWTHGSAPINSGSSIWTARAVATWAQRGWCRARARRRRTRPVMRAPPRWSATLPAPGVRRLKGRDVATSVATALNRRSARRRPKAGTAR